MTSNERLPRLFVLFAALMATLGTAVMATALALEPPTLSPQLWLVLLALLVSEIYLLRLRSYSVSLAMPLILAAIVIAGPGAAALGAAVSSVSPEDYRERRPLSLLAFNFGQLVIASTTAGWAYVATGGRALIAGEAVPLTVDTAPQALLSLCVAAIAFNGLNIVLMGVGVRIGRGVPFRVVLRDLITPLPTQMSLALVGLLLAQVLAIHPFGFPLFLLPLFLARQTYQSYADLRDAYFDMIRSLVGALEAKDRYTRGHSERVAHYARAIAVQSGCDDRTVDTVGQAALLHDIGKLSLPLSLLEKPSQLTAGEYAEIRRHPWVGGQMLGRIPALKGLAESITAHHERMDGSGYPNGLRGDEIPLIARLLAIADAYDAMTTTRAYREALSHEEAVAELRKCSGTQFDSALVDAFLESGVATREMSSTAESQTLPPSATLAS